MTAYANDPSAYDDDPRVQRYDRGYESGFIVFDRVAGEPTWRIHEFNRYQYDVVQLNPMRTGPTFPTADEAIRSLIGEPL